MSKDANDDEWLDNELAQWFEAQAKEGWAVTEAKMTTVEKHAMQCRISKREIA